MILIGVPCNESIKSRTAFSLFNIARPDTKLVMQRGADVAYNRNVLAQMAVEGSYTHLLFVDSDMAFEPDTLKKMLACDKDIVGLAANHRRLPLESVVQPLEENLVNKPLPDTLFECKSVGTGMMLIKTGVFKNIPKPWFKFEYENGERTEGEDVRFCRLAKENGYSIWVEPRISIKHIGDYLF